MHTHILVLLAVIGVLVMVKAAVRYALLADAFRQIAIEYRSHHLRMQGKKPVKEEIEKEIMLRAEELREEKL